MKLIFDIGGNVGNFTQKCLDDYKDSKIVIVEPNDDLVNILNKRFSDNKNVSILDNIVSDKSDEYKKFYISSANTISTVSEDWINNSRFSNSYSWDKVIEKKTITIDDMVQDYGTPYLIKVDVEGYEFEALSGLTEKQNYICFEWAEEQYLNINKTCQHLENIGYTDFGFIYGDEYLKNPIEFSSWEKCKIHNDIDINRKEKWGMIWVR